MRIHRLIVIASLCWASALISGCDQLTGALGLESPEKLVAARDAEGRAIGGACRHAGRAIEDCYSMNKKADKAAIFAGWRDMNDYMRENKIDAVAPQAQATAQVANARPVDGDDADAAGGEGSAAAKPGGRGGKAAGTRKGHDS